MSAQTLGKLPTPRRQHPRSPWFPQLSIRSVSGWLGIQAQDSFKKSSESLKRLTEGSYQKFWRKQDHMFAQNRGQGMYVTTMTHEHPSEISSCHSIFNSTFFLYKNDSKQRTRSTTPPYTFLALNLSVAGKEPTFTLTFHHFRNHHTVQPMSHPTSR